MSRSKGKKKRGFCPIGPKVRFLHPTKGGWYPGVLKGTEVDGETFVVMDAFYEKEFRLKREDVEF